MSVRKRFVGLISSCSWWGLQRLRYAFTLLVEIIIIMETISILATLQPTFPHWNRFANDGRLSGIRLNNPRWTPAELEVVLGDSKVKDADVPIYFDVKGWQIRVTEVHPNDAYLDLTINHPIRVETPTEVFLKAGADRAVLERIEDGGRRLIFRGGPQYLVYPGESLQIRHPSLEVLGEQFCKDELEKIEVAKRAGITRYFLSYAESSADVQRLRDLVGPDAEIMVKIENEKGLRYVTQEFKKVPNLRLVAARGDLYVEIKRPHLILNALRTIIKHDPEACVGSRLMLSTITSDVPSCADFCELAWLYDIGYRSFLLCDELCLKEELLAVAVNACEAFQADYQPAVPVPAPAPLPRKSLWGFFGRRA